MSGKTLYDIIGVARDATSEEIRQAYLLRTRVMHPDRFDQTRQPKEWKLANELLQELNRANSTLRDPVMRQRYDESIFGRVSPPPRQAQGRPTNQKGKKTDTRKFHYPDEEETFQTRTRPTQQPYQSASKAHYYKSTPPSAFDEPRFSLLMDIVLRCLVGMGTLAVSFGICVFVIGAIAVIFKISNPKPQGVAALIFIIATWKPIYRAILPRLGLRPPPLMIDGGSPFPLSLIYHAGKIGKTILIVFTVSLALFCLIGGVFILFFKH